MSTQKKNKKEEAGAENHVTKFSKLLKLVALSPDCD